MKKCPACSRTYSDETLSFCLEDGSLLSAAYNFSNQKSVIKDDEIITVLSGEKVELGFSERHSKENKFGGSVKYTGASADSLLIGMKSANEELIIRIYENQKRNFGGRIQGVFRLINAGTGNYSHYIKEFEGKDVEADELVEYIGEKEGKHNIHIFNCNMLKMVTE